VGWVRPKRWCLLTLAYYALWYFKFSRRRVWCSELSSGIYCRVKWLSTDDGWWWRQYAPLKRRSIIILHGSISQKTTLDITHSLDDMSSESDGGMILTGENRRTRRKTCTSATLSTTNPTWINPGANPDLHGEMPATDDLSHDTALRAVTWTWKHKQTNMSPYYESRQRKSYKLFLRNRVAQAV
jgi:hypothetical protein